MERLLVERLIDGEMRLVEVEHPPAHNSERRFLEGRIHLLPFVRVQRDSLLPLAERIGQSKMTQSALRRLPSGMELMNAILAELGATTAGKLVERVENTVTRPKKLNSKQRTARRQHWGKPLPVPQTTSTIVEYKTIDPQELLIFFEEEDEAMLALLKYC